MMLRLFAVCAVMAIYAVGSWADVSVQPLFGNHMVLQRGVNVPVWGKADPGEAVAVTLGDQKKETTAGEDGNWKVVFDPLEVGDPMTLEIVGKNTLKFEDVLAGEVWVCSGQSNMEWALQRSRDAEQEIAAANYPEIRHFLVEKYVGPQPRESLNGKWDVCSPETAGAFTAVGYFFGRELKWALDVPIGLINTSWGGTPAESWAEASYLVKDASLEILPKRWQTSIDDYIKARDKYVEDFKAWAAQSDAQEASGEQVANPPEVPRDVRRNPHRPSSLYNGMIKPLIPYAIRGAIWYQGESNAGRAFQYRKLFPTMITSWRETWGQGDFPFFWVQLANFRAVNPEPADSDWAELREAQSMTLSLPNTGEAVIIDIGEAADIHPRNKQDVGKRLALAAQATVYEKDIEHSGPRYDSVKFEDGKAHVKFTHAKSGLRFRDASELKGFSIAGEDKKFKWAQAKIDGDSVVVWSDDVKEPVAVRYAWADNPICNLYNGAGLPASPFRTDEWPGITVDAE